jgi:hypothetical protein
VNRVKGRYNGLAVVLGEKVDLPGNAEGDVSIPEQAERPFTALLDELDRMPVAETMSLDEVVALVHEVCEREWEGQDQR